MNNRRFPQQRRIRLPARAKVRRQTIRRGCVLHLERLECRRLLAGLQVSVFIDQDGSRNFDHQSDLVAANRLVFVDTDGNGEFSTGEPVRITDDLGRAFFEDLEPGNHRVGVIANVATQRPTTAVVIDSQVQLVAEHDTGLPAVDRLLADPGLQNIWSVDLEGYATRLPSTADSSGLSSVDFGGRLVDVLSPQNHASSEEHILVVEPPAGSSNRLLRFDVESGAAHELRVLGLAEGMRIEEVQKSSFSWLALVNTDGVLSVHGLDMSDTYATVGERLADGVLGFSASPDRSGFAALEPISGNATRVVLVERGQSQVQSMEFEDLVESLDFSADGQTIFASLAQGGVQAISVDSTGLERQAILRDAKGPVTSTSVDGRVITQSRTAPQKLIVWDPSRWLPSGTITLPENVRGGVESIVTDRFGDRAVIAVKEATLVAELAMPQLVPVEVESGRQATIDFGLRIVGDNQAPTARPVERVIPEDTSDLDGFDLATDVIDADGDQLWFALETPPRHGSLLLTGQGQWEYAPDENYFGQDSAVVRVHDGQAYSDLLLQWEIEAVNDPPLAIHIQLPPISENVLPGTSVGFISIADPDADAEYRITTSDPRFNVEGGQIYFNEGELDFDTEPNVRFQLVATDAEQPEYVISAETTLVLKDVNEPPDGIELTLYGDGVLENTPGAAVGTVRVLDQDADSQYEIEVSDERFEIVEGELRLVDGQELDFEASQQLGLLLTAVEVGGEGYSLSSESSVPVVNQNEAPISIQLSQTNIEGGVPGATVGHLTVLDPDGDHYIFTPHDSRFEVQGGMLKLKDDQSLDPNLGNVDLGVSARSISGDQISGHFPLVVQPLRPPFQNPVNPYDVNGDGSLTPLDVLEVINDINNGGGGPLPPHRDPGGGAGEDPYMPDVNGDGQVSPIDVLHLVNELNNQNRNGEGEWAGGFSVASSPVSLSDLESRKRQNSVVDMELERLLDQICRHRLSDDA